MTRQKAEKEGGCREDAGEASTSKMDPTYRSGFHTTLLEFLKSWCMDFGSVDELELTLGAGHALGFGRHDCRGPQLTCKEDVKRSRYLFGRRGALH